jgi:hypothetical protein
MTIARTTTVRAPKPKLAVTKQTLKDLRPSRTVRGGGFIMKDSMIVRTTGWTC